MVSATTNTARMAAIPTAAAPRFALQTLPDASGIRGPSVIACEARKRRHRFRPADDRFGSNPATNRLFADLSRSFSCPSKSRPYSRSCVGRQLGARKRLMHCSEAPPYSITSSARASSDGGIVRPSVLAVLRLSRARKRSVATRSSEGGEHLSMRSTSLAAGCHRPARSPQKKRTALLGRLRQRDFRSDDAGGCDSGN